MKAIHRCGLIAALIVAIGQTLPVRAAHTVPLPMSELADLAAQVIVGDVASVRSYWAENPKRIETRVVFEHVEYLKGALPDSGSTFTLVLPGGQVGEMRMRLCCAPEFAVGERWCLFLPAESSFFPVVGFNQGALRIAADADGVERVRASDGRTITGLDPDGFVQIAGEPPAHEPLVRESHGVRIVPREAAPPAAAQSFAEFRAEIGPILTASKRVALTAPAGRYVPAPFIPTALKASTSDRAAHDADGEPAEPARGVDHVRRAHPQKPREAQP